MKTLGEMNHSKLLAKVGTYKYCLDISEFKKIFLIVHGEYFLQMAIRTGGDVSFFSSEFTQMLEKNVDILKHSNTFKVDRLSKFDFLESYAGCCLAKVASLPADLLTQIKHMEFWQKMIGISCKNKVMSLAEKVYFKKKSYCFVSR